MESADPAIPHRRWRPDAGPPAPLRKTHALWISAAVHGALVVGGLSLAGAAAHSGSSTVLAPRIVLESHAPVTPPTSMAEAVPEPAAPAAPATPEPTPADPTSHEPAAAVPPQPADAPPQEAEPEPVRDWRPFDGPVTARMRLPKPRPDAQEQPAMAAPQKPLATTTVALTTQREEVPASQAARTATRNTDATATMPVPSRRLTRRLKRIAENYAGVFIFAIEVDVDGSVRPGVRLLSASGPRFLTASIIDALESGRFKPATRAGRPVRMADKIKIVGGASSAR